MMPREESNKKLNKNIEKNKKRGTGEGEPKTAYGRQSAKADAAAAVLKEQGDDVAPETDILTSYVLPGMAAAGSLYATGNPMLAAGAFSATQNFATGLKEEDWGKVGEGALQGALTYGGAKAAQGKDYSGIFEGVGWDELSDAEYNAKIDEYLMFEEKSRLLG